MSDRCLICGEEFLGESYPGNPDTYHMTCLLKERDKLKSNAMEETSNDQFAKFLKRKANNDSR